MSNFVKEMMGLSGQDLKGRKFVLFSPGSLQNKNAEPYIIGEGEGNGPGSSSGYAGLTTEQNRAWGLPSGEEMEQVAQQLENEEEERRQLRQNNMKLSEKKSRKKGRKQ